MRRKTAIITISFLICALAAVGAEAWMQNKKADEAERFIAHNFQHAFGEVVNGMSEIDTALQKSMFVTSPSAAGAVCTEIFGKAMTTQMSLGVLPFSNYELERTSGFISKVGDYAYSLSRAAARGEAITEEQRQNLTALSQVAGKLTASMRQLQEDLEAGGLTMDSMRAAEAGMEAAEDRVLPQTLGDGMRLIEKEFPEVPSLIYDGPFSEHLTDIAPKALEGMKEIDENGGRECAAHFLGTAAGKVYPVGESQGDIPAYYYGTEIEGGELTVAVSKQGGMVVGMISSRMAAGGKCTPEQAIKTAERFLTSRGFNNMRETYYYSAGNNITINFAYVQDGVMCYSDLIKVTVAADTGEVSGFEAAGYLTSHCEREIQEAAVSEEQARESIPDSLTELAYQLVIVPSEGKYEVLCHEFKCQAESGQKYIIYVNAQSGEQEKILILLEDENGALAI